MRHSTVDQYAKKSSFYTLDPRAKTVAIIIFVVFVAILRDLVTLGLAFIFIVSITVISNVPLRHISKRYAIALPFIVFAALAMFISHDFISSVSPLGSIAVDGISLTVQEKRGNNFFVYVIAYTLKNSTLGFRYPSSKVNIEIDKLGTSFHTIKGRPAV